MPVRRRPARPARAVVFVLGVVLAAACGGPADAPELGIVRVGAGPDTESLLLAETMVALLDARGVPAEVVGFADARDSRRALELADVELRVGYSGEAWLEVLGLPDPPGDPWQSVEAVREHDLDRGIVWLVPTGDDAGDDAGVDARDEEEAVAADGGADIAADGGAEGAAAAIASLPNATFAFVVAGPPAVDADLRTVSQLAARLAERPDATVCVDGEFGERLDGLRAVLAAYSVRSDRPFLAADPAEAVLGVVAGDCLAGLTTATDGAAWRAGLVPLVDDLAVFPAFVPLPQVRLDVLETRPELAAALRPLVTELTTSDLARANGRVLAGLARVDVATELARLLSERAALEGTSDTERANAEEG